MGSAHSRFFYPLAPRLITNVGVSILLRASPHARDPEFHDVSAEIFIMRLQSDSQASVRGSGPFKYDKPLLPPRHQADVHTVRSDSTPWTCCGSAL